MNTLPSELILNSIPEVIVWKDLESRYTAITLKAARMIGLNSISSLIGISDSEIINGPSQYADRFIEQDKHVIQSKKQQQYFEVYRYCDELKALISSKIPLKDEQQNIVGICCHLQVLNAQDSARLASQLFLKNKNLDSLSYSLYQHEEHSKLTKREIEVLMYLLYGKTTRDISHILCRSIRTIEAHFLSLKTKFNVNSKSQLIEAAIDKGYLASIPEWMLTQEFSIPLFS